MSFFSRFIRVLFAVSALRLSGQELTSSKGIHDLIAIAKRFEIAPMKKPAWVEESRQPEFRIAWLSDMHLIDAKSIELTKSAFRHVRGQKGIALTLITGDNAKIAEEEPKKLPLGERRHRWLKSFLETELGSIPYAITPGDNWPWDFEKVFGPQTRSIDVGGLHFVLTATDARAMEKETTSVFFDDTKAWLEEELKQHADKPTLFVLHESILPPCFPDAVWAAALLDKNPNVIAALAGHLHLDLEFKRGHWKQFCCPALGPSHRPGIKILNVFKDKIVIESHEWNRETNQFAKVNKWQLLAIPERFQSSINGTDVKPKMVNTTAGRGKVVDKALLERANEVEDALMQFIFTFGMKQLGM
ncbi:MAG: metallophosphoesterase [Lentisphaerae bacterium]|nr:metallophosphoesterase [Lentisphaerota bacterium]